MISHPSPRARRHQKVHPAAVRRAEYRRGRRLMMTFTVACARQGGAVGVLAGLFAAEAVRIYLKFCPGVVRVGGRTVSLTVWERSAAELVELVATAAAVAAVAVRPVGRNGRAVEHRGELTRARVVSCPRRGPDVGSFLTRIRPATDRLPAVT